MVPYCESEFNATYSYESGSFVTIATPSDSLGTDASCLVLNYVNHSIDATCPAFLSDIENNSSFVKAQGCSHEGLVFDQKVVLNSVVTQYGLTCDNRFVKNVIGATYMVIVSIFG